MKVEEMWTNIFIYLFTQKKEGNLKLGSFIFFSFYKKKSRYFFKNKYMDKKIAQAKKNDTYITTITCLIIINEKKN